MHGGPSPQARLKAVGFSAYLQHFRDPPHAGPAGVVWYSSDNRKPPRPPPGGMFASAWGPDPFIAEAVHYVAGEQKLTGFFIGQIMKKSGGKADPKAVSRILQQKAGR